MELEGRVIRLLVGRVIRAAEPLEEKEIGVAGRRVERICHVHDHIRRPELHPGSPPYVSQVARHPATNC